VIAKTIATCSGAKSSKVIRLEQAAVANSIALLVHVLIHRPSPGGIFRYFPTALPKLDCAIVCQLLCPFSGCALVCTNQINPARNLPIRPEQEGPVFFHRIVPVARAYGLRGTHLELV
jgi:hypothetical protein